MSFRIISSLVILFCCLVKLFGFQIFFLLLCFCFIFVCLCFALILSQSTTNTLKSFIYCAAADNNPLDDRIQRSLGLKFVRRKSMKCRNIKLQNEHESEPHHEHHEHKRHSKKHSLIHNFMDHLHLSHNHHNNSHRKNSLDLDHHSFFENIKIHGDQLTGDPLDNRRRDDDIKRTSSSSRKVKMLTGYREIDKIIHQILDCVLETFLDSWFNALSDNKEFTLTTRSAAEDAIAGLIKRIKQAPLLSIITTKMIDDVANHARLFREASEIVSESSRKNSKPSSKFNSPAHRRNKSETDVTWNIGSASIQKNVANSTFYSVQTDEKLLDPEKQLIEIFFDNSRNLYKEEATSDEALECHLKSVMESVLYFGLQTENFSCEELRSLLAALLAHVVGKAVISNITDPDFINLQMACNLATETPSADYLIKMIRLCTDLSELRAVRQLITREMDNKYRDPSCVGELASLKFSQKIIDMRISNIQNHRDVSGRKIFEKEKFTSKLPLLTLDEILSKDLALSYYLDYLSILNLQKYVIFYSLAQNWRLAAIDRLALCHEELDRQQVLQHLRDKAYDLYKEYLIPSSVNYLNIDQGLIEVLHIRIKDTFLQTETNWFDSISKFVYEKLKNEDVFLQNFYQSSAYKKLIMELEEAEVEIPEMKILESQESGSDSNSGDFLIDEIDLLEDKSSDNSLDPNIFRHQRSHSDTGVINLQHQASTDSIDERRKIQAKIINTALISDGNFAVYAIHVTVIDRDENDEQQQKSWHIYRRYSKFLELKKELLRRFPQLQKVAIPFPKKQTFQNTNRSVLERRMIVLNEFLQVICAKAEMDAPMRAAIRDFLEPDMDDKQIHGTKIVKHLVNPLKSGMKTIKSMPDTFIGGLSRIFLAKDVVIEDKVDASNADHPSLISLVNLLDAVFDLEARSHWLKKGIQRLLSAPWVSQAVNRKIQETAQRNLMEADKIEAILAAVLTSVEAMQEPKPREDNTQLRTRMAAKIALFSLLSDELRHFLGSETTRIGLMTFFEMLQHKELNKRLILVLLHRLLTSVFPTDSMTKHVVNAM